MTREPIDYIFDQRDVLLSLRIGFSFVTAALACAILERISGFDPSFETTASRYVLRYSPSDFYTWSPSGCHLHILSSVWSSKH